MNMVNQQNVTKIFNLLVHICLVLVLSACGKNDDGATTTETKTEVPQFIQQVAALNVANGNLEAWITIDNEPPTQMTIDSDAGTAIYSITLSRSVHSVLIEFFFSDGVDTVTLATAAQTVDLSAGDTDLVFTDADYTVDYDDDGDGKTNLEEIIDGTDPLLMDVTDITITDSVVPNDDLEIPFGTVSVDGTAEQTVTITNDGTADLVLGTLGGTNPLALPFSILNDNCSGQTLAPAVDCTVTVRFAPLAKEIYNDSFDIPSNDPDEASVTMRVGGMGDVIVPDITVTDSVAPADDLSVPFGRVTVGETADQTVTIANDGAADLVLGTLGSTDPLAVPFSIPQENDKCSGQTLAPALDCTITVRFAPLTAGIYNDSFDIPSNDPDRDEASVIIRVSGTGEIIVPDITVTDSVAPADDLSVPFGRVAVGETADQTVTIANDGAVDLVLGTLGGTDPLAVPFSIPRENDKCSGQTLAPGMDCSVTVRYAPLEVRVYNDSFDIPNNDPDPDERRVIVSVDGTVAVPQISVSPTTLSFLACYIPSSSMTRTATVSNTGDATLIISSITKSGSSEFFMSHGCSTSLLPEASCTISVTFTPTSRGTSTGSVTIVSNDGTATISLTGIGENCTL